MTLAAADLLAASQSHAEGLGHFERVNGHEPKNAPGTGLSAALWVQELRPVRGRSGLDSTTVCVTLNVRLAMPMTHEPQDGIDPTILAAADALMAAYTGDFTLGGKVAQVDLLGAHGEPLNGKAGYFDHNGQVYRAFVIVLPLIVDDLWEQDP